MKGRGKSCVARQAWLNRIAGLRRALLSKARDCVVQVVVAGLIPSTFHGQATVVSPFADRNEVALHCWVPSASSVSLTPDLYPCVRPGWLGAWWRHTASQIAAVLQRDPYETSARYADRTRTATQERILEFGRITRGQRFWLSGYCEGRWDADSRVFACESTEVGASVDLGGRGGQCDLHRPDVRGVESLFRALVGRRCGSIYLNALAVSLNVDAARALRAGEPVAFLYRVPVMMDVYSPDQTMTRSSSPALLADMIVQEGAVLWWCVPELGGDCRVL